MAQKFSDIVIPPAAEGQRLDRVLSQLLPELSRSRLKQLIEAGQVLWNGRLCPTTLSEAAFGGQAAIQNDHRCRC